MSEPYISRESTVAEAHADQAQLERAVEAFVRGFSDSKSRTHPYVETRNEGVRAMHDAPRTGRTGYRKAELVNLAGEPAQVDREARQLARSLGPAAKRWFLCAIRTEADLSAVEQEYAALGYRLMAREAFFTYELGGSTEVGVDSASRVRPVVGESDVREFFRWAKLRVTARDLDAVAVGRIRRYVSLDGEEVVGSVASVAAGEATRWVSALYVAESHRRQGRGSELMRRMLLDDAATGNTLSVLLASKTGARLYPQLGYRQIGTLLLYRPK
ncbi:MAG: GNAT family N-acetyltransferase [Fimbriimonadaceae bacterium]|nr:GNAT family N-acetyltransferase [Fimbriimonadaceae bacterium]